MSREILFRAKRIDNGEWVEGIAFPHDGTQCSILYQHPADGSLVGTEVDPATVGQYTGMVDKHGKKIFEGDVVHCISQYDNANMAVIFEDGEFRMVIASKLPEYETGMGFFSIRCFNKEVIGNIHDTEATPCTE